MNIVASMGHLSMRKRPRDITAMWVELRVIVEHWKRKKTCFHVWNHVEYMKIAENMLNIMNRKIKCLYRQIIAK